MADSAKIYRCGQCDEDWPLFTEYRKCPKCNTACAEVAIDKGLKPDREEAKRKAAYYKFERFLEGESDAEREKRQAKFRRENPESATTFDEVIAAAGFQDWERQNILNLERQLRAQEARMRAA